MHRRANRTPHLIPALLCVGAMQFAATARAQEASAPTAAAIVMERVSAIREQGFRVDNALTELVAFEKLDAEYQSSTDYPGNLVLTMVYEAHSFLGNHAAALRTYDQRYARYAPDYSAYLQSKPSGSIDPTDLQSAAALKVLAELAQSAQVIMINEAHHMPRHRDFTRQALALLRMQGFSYFAAETFEEEADLLQRRGFPIISSGRYTREPMFAEMVRAAIREGYRLVAYEGIVPGGSDAREQAQARNLIDRVLKHDPKAKLLVHAGFSHISEQGPDKGERKYMAQYFKEWSGIDPLTVDQTEMMEHSAPEYEAPLYAKVLQKFQPIEAIVLRSSDGKPLSAQPGNYDLTVFHPRTTYQNARPAWLATSTGRRSYTLPKKICGRAKSCVVQARRASEGDTAIAVDQIEVTAEQTWPATLLLPGGEFDIDVRDAAGKQLKRLTAKISSSPPQAN